jgi:hypothetical protein
MTTFAHCAPCYLLYDSMTRMGSISLLHIPPTQLSPAIHGIPPACLASKRIKGTVSQDYDSYNSGLKKGLYKQVYICSSKAHAQLISTIPPPKKKV